LAALLLLSGGPFLAEPVILWAGNCGRLTVELVGDGVQAKVVIRRGQQQVKILDLAMRRKVVLEAGEYGIELADAAPGLRLDTGERLTLRRGETVVVRVQ